MHPIFYTEASVFLTKVTKCLSILFFVWLGGKASSTSKYTLFPIEDMGKLLGGTTVHAVKPQYQFSH